ncbi:hypothetical protein HCU40_09870 [Pseudanabaena biceps]|nr:hypothetical protein [Pseudanabaena biceps]
MSKFLFRDSTRLLLTTALILGSCFTLAKSVLADSTPPNTPITNTAIGTFEGTTSGTTGSVTSNTVTISVLEVAGITATSSGNQEASLAVTNAGTYQGIAGINTGDVVYFDFTVTNVGNDPTAFFIPGTATISGGTFENIQIIAVDPDGSGIATSTTLAVTVPAGTGGDTIALLGATNGYIPVNGTVTVRVAVKVTETIVGNAIAVTLGDTSTSLGSQNQPYIANGTNDLYTVDLANNTVNPYPVATFPSVSQVVETDGNPTNGDVTNNRQEASATQSVNLAATPVIFGYKSVTLTTDADTNNSVTPNDTLTWRITYANTGTVDVTNFQIADVLPANVTLFGSLAAANITVNAAQASATPSPNTSYTGIAGNENLFVSTITLKAGGVINVDIPVKVNAAVPNGTVLSNQPTASSNVLPIAGVKTDNIDGTNNALPLSIPAPTGSITQTQTAAIEPTTATVLGTIVATPKLVLVKRITAINDVAIAGFVNDGVASSADDEANWPTPLDTYLRGAVDVPNVKPSDRLEYTIYFLVIGNTNVTNVTICDLVPAQTTYVDQAYNVIGGGSNLGVAFANSNTALPSAPTNYLTGLFDSDRANFYPANVLPPNNCTKPSGGSLSSSDNTDGIVVVSIVTSPTILPFATSPGTPSSSYGFVRFQVKVK